MAGGPDGLLAAYAQHGSIKGAARALGVSPQKARRALLCVGALETQRAREVRAVLGACGQDAGRAAAALGISRNAVIAYMPYQRGMYTGGRES